MACQLFIKQGALLQLSIQVQQDDATPIDLTGATLFSEIRDQLGNLVATPTITVTNAAGGQATYSAASDTTWPIGQVRSDIFIQIGGVPFFTQTFLIGVAAPVTALADRG